MGFRESLRAHLAGDGTISGLVGERIYPIRLPEGTEGPSAKPALVYMRPGINDETDLSSGDGSLQRVRVQVDAWASSAEVANQLGELVRVRMQSATVAANSFVLGAAFGQDDYDFEAKLFRYMNDFTVWYRTS